MKFAGAGLCLLLAALAWDFQEHNADVHSPRDTVVGPVTYVLAERHKGGSIDDRVQIERADGSFSPVLETETIASEASKQPIHKGDQLEITYRIWDAEPLQIYEIAGLRAGWRYTRPQYAWGRTVAATVVALLSLIWLTREYLRAKNGEELTYLTDNDETPKTEIQTLGL